MSATGSLVSSTLLLTLTGAGLVATYDDWGHVTSDAATSAAGDAIGQLSIVPLRVAEAHATSDGERLTGLRFIVKARAGETANLYDVRVEAWTQSERVWLASAEVGDLVVERLHDPDVSVLSGVLGPGDVVRFDLDLRPLSSPIGMNDEFSIRIHFPGARPMHLAFEVPARLTPVTPVAFNELL